VRIDRAWTVTLGLRSTFESDVWIKVVSDTARVHVGDHTFVGRATEIDVSLQVVIGAHVLIAPRVFITDHKHNIAADRLIDSQGCTAAPVTIGDDVWLGTGCVVLPGVTIGAGAAVGAGAVVTRDVAPNSIVVGIPAREIGLRS
jgi:acetyltransferase-like isoleucine patch superfamily enzyme